VPSTAKLPAVRTVGATIEVPVRASYTSIVGHLGAGNRVVRPLLVPGTAWSSPVLVSL
jgi:hypothetical protein